MCLLAAHHATLQPPVVRGLGANPERSARRDAMVSLSIRCESCCFADCWCRPPVDVRCRCCLLLAAVGALLRTRGAIQRLARLRGREPRSRPGGSAAQARAARGELGRVEEEGRTVGATGQDKTGQARPGQAGDGDGDGDRDGGRAYRVGKGIRQVARCSALGPSWGTR